MSKLNWPSIGCAALLAACSRSENIPPLNTINRIEAIMAKTDCIGSLDKWERTYSYKRLPGSNHPDTPMDKGIIEIDFRQAGFADYKAGQFIVEKPKPADIDDRQYDVAVGEYDMKTRKISLWACGPNMPES